ncbi:MAG: hypothetical protein O2898_02680 [Proteobacteria bacterium]|nr:hypothetical protein [Pseudomonadota bacterium]
MRAPALAFAATVALALWAGAAGAQAFNVRPDGTATLPAEKLRVEGAVIVYDTVDVPDEHLDILPDDAAAFRAMLLRNPQVRVVHLNSYGGELTEARDMADMVTRRGLSTRVTGTCDSACVLIFLAGDQRSLASGAAIGFHRFSWAADSVRDFYDANAQDFDWSDPFDLAEWLYEDTQVKIFEHLNYMLARGVDPGFAIQTLREDSEGMWYPPRAVLIASGVVTDADPESSDIPGHNRRRSQN